MSWMDEAWRLIDRPTVATTLNSAPPMVFVTISGAHCYGFASADSDIDVRGVFILPLEDLIGLREPRDNLSFTRTVNGTELDFVAHDLRKFAHMMTRHNGLVLEQLYSPLVFYADFEILNELRGLGLGCLTTGLYRHYFGFARGRRKRLREPGATVKHLLYAYRALMTGIHVLQGHGIEANINVLNEHFRLPQIADLVARKSAGSENQHLGQDELSIHELELDHLEVSLQVAHEKSRLPDEPTTDRELNDCIIRIRLAQSGAAMPNDRPGMDG